MAIRTRANFTPSALVDKLQAYQTPAAGRTYTSPTTSSHAVTNAKNTVADLVKHPVAPENVLGFSAAAPNADDYDQRLAALLDQQKTDLGVWDEQNLPVISQLGRDIADLQQQLQHAQGLSTVGASDWGQGQPDVAGIQAALAAKQDQLAGLTGERNALLSEQKSVYNKAGDAAKQIRAHVAAQKLADSINEERIKAYEASLAPYNTSADAYNKYVTDEADWAQKAAALQADIDAGKYRVDPFVYLRAGNRTIPEINALREQINAGNLHPDMGVPDLPPAPAVVQRPGDAPTIPQLEQGPAPINVDPSIANILGYQAPPPKQVTLKQATKVSDTPQPAPPPAPKANPEAKPAPVTNPGTVNQSTQPPPSPPTTQQTPQQSAVTTQAIGGATPSPAPAAPINPSASLPAQTSGSVAGQSTGSGASNSTKSSEPAPTPAMMQQPTPFKDPDKDVEQKDKPWEL